MDAPDGISTHLLRVSSRCSQEANGPALHGAEKLQGPKGLRLNYRRLDKSVRNSFAPADSPKITAKLRKSKRNGHKRAVNMCV